MNLRKEIAETTETILLIGIIGTTDISQKEKTDLRVEIKSKRNKEMTTHVHTIHDE